MRAARFTSMLAYSPSAASAPSPVCRPIRTFTSASAGHAWAWSARCASAAARIAAGADAKTTKKASPSVPETYPSPNASRNRREWSSISER